MSTFEEVVEGVEIEAPKYVLLASQRVCRFDHEEGVDFEGNPKLMTKCGIDAWNGYCTEPYKRNHLNSSWTPGEPCWLCFDRSEFKGGRLTK